MEGLLIVHDNEQDHRRAVTRTTTTWRLERVEAIEGSGQGCRARTSRNHHRGHAVKDGNAGALARTEKPNTSYEARRCSARSDVTGGKKVVKG
ncbi:hypothetical protein [Nonomuraea dietziae]|uniref:hypothetical protein n=1 Tax=Nonomuraea dietziae TaxID=65515 RepID=UPI0031D4E771